jgi:hypothetical protein
MMGNVYTQFVLSVIPHRQNSSGSSCVYVPKYVCIYVRTYAWYVCNKYVQQIHHH